MSNFKIDDRIIYKSFYGTIKYIGETKIKKFNYGIELDTPNGKNDGQMGGIRYFKCKPKHGVFALLSQITLVNDKSINTENIENKSEKKVTIKDNKSNDMLKTLKSFPYTNTKENELINDNLSNISTSKLLKTCDDINIVKSTSDNNMLKTFNSDISKLSDNKISKTNSVNNISKPPIKFQSPTNSHNEVSSKQNITEIKVKSSLAKPTRPSYLSTCSSSIPIGNTKNITKPVKSVQKNDEIIRQLNKDIETLKSLKKRDRIECKIQMENMKKETDSKIHNLETEIIKNGKVIKQLNMEKENINQELMNQKEMNTNKDDDLIEMLTIDKEFAEEKLEDAIHQLKEANDEIDKLKLENIDLRSNKDVIGLDPHVRDKYEEALIQMKYMLDKLNEEKADIESLRNIDAENLIILEEENGKLKELNLKLTKDKEEMSEMIDNNMDQQDMIDDLITKNLIFEAENERLKAHISKLDDEDEQKIRIEEQKSEDLLNLKEEMDCMLQLNYELEKKIEMIEKEKTDQSVQLQNSEKLVKELKKRLNEMSLKFDQERKSFQKQISDTRRYSLRPGTTIDNITDKAKLINSKVNDINISNSILKAELYQKSILSCFPNFKTCNNLILIQSFLHHLYEKLELVINYILTGNTNTAIIYEGMDNRSYDSYQKTIVFQLRHWKNLIDLLLRFTETCDVDNLVELAEYKGELENHNESIDSIIVLLKRDRLYDRRNSVLLSKSIEYFQQICRLLFDSIKKNGCVNYASRLCCAIDFIYYGNKCFRFNLDWLQDLVNNEEDSTNICNFHWLDELIRDVETLDELCKTIQCLLTDDLFITFDPKVDEVINQIYSIFPTLIQSINDLNNSINLKESNNRDDYEDMIISMKSVMNYCFQIQKLLETRDCRTKKVITNVNTPFQLYLQQLQNEMLELQAIQSTVNLKDRQIIQLTEEIQSLNKRHNEDLLRCDLLKSKIEVLANQIRLLESKCSKMPEDNKILKLSNDQNTQNTEIILEDTPHEDEKENEDQKFMERQKSYFDDYNAQIGYLKETIHHITRKLNHARWELSNYKLKSLLTASPSTSAASLFSSSISQLELVSVEQIRAKNQLYQTLSSVKIIDLSSDNVAEHPKITLINKQKALEFKDQLEKIKQNYCKRINQLKEN